MKQFLYSLICFFVLAFISSNAAVIEVPDAVAWMQPAIIGGSTAQVCGSTGEYDENFDSTGYCNSNLGTNETVGSGDTLNEDDSSPADGTYSLEIDCSNTDNSTFTYDTAITENTNNATPMYYYIRIYPEGEMDSQWAYFAFLSIQDGGTTPSTTASYWLQWEDTGSAVGRIGLKPAGGTRQATGNYATSNWRTIKIKVNDDADVSGIEWCVDDVLQTTAVTDSDLNEDTVFFGFSATQQGTTGTVNIDSFIQSTDSTDIGWGDCS